MADTLQAEWYKIPYKWLYPEDIAILENTDKSQRHYAAMLMVYEFLRDRGTYRPLENKVFARLFMRALDHLYRDTPMMTNKQQRTYALLTEANAFGLNAAKHIADKEDITVQSAYRRLKTLENKAKTVNIVSLFENIYDNSDIEPARHDKKQIDRILMSMRVRCAGDGMPGCSGTARADIGACPSCLHEHHATKWFEPHRAHVRREAYADAKARYERSAGDGVAATIKYERLTEAA